MGRLKPRPSVKLPWNSSSVCVSPHSATSIELLGGVTRNGVTVSKGEFEAMQRLYRMKQEKQVKRPPEPVPPKSSEFPSDREYAQALSQYEEAHARWRKWEDPSVLLQAGADVGTFRCAEEDGLRMVAWIAKFASPGEDPLKVLVRMAADAGFDASSDLGWAEEEEQ